jgi:hypothetical protein
LRVRGEVCVVQVDVTCDAVVGHGRVMCGPAAAAHAGEGGETHVLSSSKKKDII